MKIAEEYIKMLGMDDDKLIEYINKMSEKEAKGLLFQMISFSNNKRRKEIEKMNEQKRILQYHVASTHYTGERRKK